MEANTIIQVATVAVTLFLGIVGLIVNTLLQRRNNSIHTITEKRIERRTKTQKCVAKLIKYSDNQFLDAIDKKEFHKVKEKTIKYCSILRSMYTYTYWHDKELCEAAFELKIAIFDYIDKKINAEKLLRKREKFTNIADIYMQTDWSRIKVETTGKSFNLSAKDEFNDAFVTYKEKMRSNF